ncbi:MAG: UDP-N-acetylmuramate dehydrogenase [Halioglobus sp.]|nr:UDP-N-acetylmuramate dehydrogenase [Halioglobus sp.]
MQFARDVSLRRLNTLALDGRASLMATVTDAEDLDAALEIASAEGRKVIVLGEGSNVVIAGDLDAVVLKQASRGIEVLERDAESVSLRVQAGENWHRFVQWTLEQGYYGLQNLALIPGTVGAAPVQNIGAYGVELGAFLRRVHAVRLRDGQRLTLSRAACELGYRDSIFKGAQRDTLCITAVDLELGLHPETNTRYPVLDNFLREAGIDTPTPGQVFDAVVSIRRSRLPDPASEPNAGSFFKNPVLTADAADHLRNRFPSLPLYPQEDGSIKLPAAWLIEYCGWKGWRGEGVGVHAEHALVLLNCGGGTGGELLSLARKIAESVRDTFGLDLVIEPRVYGHER